MGWDGRQGGEYHTATEAVRHEEVSVVCHVSRHGNFWHGGVWR